MAERRPLVGAKLARDGLESAAFSQSVRVIVNDHREQSSVDRLLLQGITCARLIGVDPEARVPMDFAAA
ncbi:hypothetical protein EMIT048CA2_10190 [Pseudomonas chlororaphis]